MQQIYRITPMLWLAEAWSSGGGGGGVGGGGGGGV